MNTGSLIIDNMFLPNMGAAPAPSKPTPTQNTPSPVRHESDLNRAGATNSADNPSTANTPETAATDNNHINARSEAADQQQQDFEYTLGEKITLQTPPAAQNGTESEKQNQTPNVTAQPNSAEPGLAQDLLGLATGKDQDTAEVLVRPQVANKSAQLFADLKVARFPLAAAQTAGPANTELGRMIPATSQPQPASKHTAAKAVLGAGQSAVDQAKIGLKTVLPDTSSEPLINDTQSKVAKGVDKAPASNKTVIATEKAPASQENIKELMSEVLTTAEKPATAAEKTAMAGTSSAYDTQKTSQAGGKESMPQAPVDGDSKVAADGEKPALPGDQKTPLLNDSFTTVQGKPSGSRAQLVGIGPEKSAPVAEKPNNGKADVNQHTSLPTPGLSESADANGKVSQHTVGSLSADSIIKNLNPQQLQISTAQTKDPTSSTANNTSNSNADCPDHILSANNPHTSLIEQSSAFSQAAKPAENASPGNVFPSINEQIQESIYLLSRRGDQQITIRLNPPELGRVVIKFQEQQDQIVGLLEVSKAQTRAEIQQALPQITQNLQDLGIRIKRLEVVLTNDQSQQLTFKDQPLQDGWFGRHGSTESGDPDSYSVNEWLADAKNYRHITEPQEMLVNDNSINVLM